MNFMTLKEVALDGHRWGNRFGRGYEPIAKRTKKLHLFGKLGYK